MRVNLVILISCLALSLNALDRTWTNAMGNNLWNDDDNWMPAGIPGSLDSVNTFYGDVLIIPNGFSTNIKHLRLLGELTIEVNAELNIDGGYMNLFGEVTNKGTITITNSPDWGIFQSTLQADNNPFVNEGKIYISNTGNSGLYVRFDQNFSNRAGAYIEIDDTATAGLDLEGSLTNLGWIAVSNSLIESSLLMNHPKSGLTNLACGKLTFPEQITFIDGNFINFGLLQTNYTGDHLIVGEDIINYKFVEDVNGAFEAGDFNQLGMWFHPYDGERIKTGQQVQLFSGTVPLNTVFGDVYTDRMLTNFAGSFEQTTLTWTSNNNAGGLSSFFMELEDVDAGGCKDTIKFTISEPVQTVNFWLGGSGNWTQGIRWSYGTVPTSTDTVGIFNVNDNVTIPLNAVAFAGQIFIEGRLIVGTFGSLTLMGDNTDVGIKIEGGKLENYGTLLTSHLSYGIICKEGEIINHGTLEGKSNNRTVELQGSDSVRSLFTNEGNFVCNSATALTMFSSDAVNNDEFNLETDGNFLVITGDSLFNNGVINISGTGKTEGEAINSATINQVMGEINISNIQYGIGESMTNYGKINLNTCDKGIYNSGDFVNKQGGEIDATHCNVAVEPKSKPISNEEGGLLNLHNNDIGMQSLSRSSFFTITNFGTINIDTTVNDAVIMEGLYDQGGEGLLSISNAGENGILMQNNGELSILGRSQLVVNKTQKDGIRIQNAELEIAANASVDIDSTGMNGIMIFGENIPFLVSIVNAGDISIGPAILGEGIQNFGDFENIGRVIIRNSMGEAYRGKNGSTFTNLGEFVLLDQME